MIIVNAVKQIMQKSGKKKAESGKTESGKRKSQGKSDLLLTNQ
jgi:hypothetical protein